MTENIFNHEYDFIDLEPFRNGDKKMRYRCSFKDSNGTRCNEPIDITKEYIIMEEQNNIRKQAPDYNPACDKLYIFGKHCKKHEDKN